MVGNIGIGIANAIGFRRKNLGGGHISYPGLIAAWSAKGKTNEDADRNVLKDLTGNGHDITLNNFAYSGMSGYGGYNFDMTKMWGSSLNPDIKKVYKTYATIKTDNFPYSYIRVGRIQANTGLTNLGVNVRFRIRGLKNNQRIRWFYSNISGYTEEEHYFYENGILEFYVPEEIKSNGLVDISFMADKNDSVNVTIELLPEYPDALVFDGVDDYGVNESIKDVLNGCEEYTVIAKRKLQNPDGRKCNFMISSTNYNHINTNFQFEYVNINNQHMTYSGGCINNVNFTDLITYQTPTSYNQQIIKDNGNRVCNGIVIGNNSTAGDMFIKCAFYSAYLFNRTLTDQEIKSFIRKYIDPEYLLPSEQIPTPDVYYDFTNGDNSKGEANNVIKDLSGNGNDATAHNFAWNEQSGYAEGGD